MRVLKPNKIDFLRRAGEDPAKSAKKRRNLLLIIPLILLVIGFAAAEGWCIYRMRTELQPRIDELNLYVEDPQVLSDYDNAMQLTYERDTLQMEYDNLVSVKDAISSYPEFTVGLYTKITSAANSNDVSLTSLGYDRASGGLVITANTQDMKNVPAFVKALKASQAFGDNVLYNGEAWQTGDGGGAFGFAINCTVTEG